MFKKNKDVRNWKKEGNDLSYQSQQDNDVEKTPEDVINLLKQRRKNLKYIIIGFFVIDIIFFVIFYITTLP
jgi:hypothetical protein